MSARTDLVDILETAFDGIANVYESPADIVATPAVVVTPGDPYQTPAAFSAASGLTVKWEFEVVVAVPRATVSPGLTVLENLAATLRAALKSSSFRWLETSGLETLAVADTEYFGLRIDVDRIATDL